MITDKISEYGNGNCVVKIFEDGSKIRQWPEGEIAAPKFPESIDLKITNHCSGGSESRCMAHCHERSNPNGKHGDLDFIKSILNGLPPGVEIAIGGGNPLSYPQLIELLSYIGDQGLIANLTVNSVHLSDPLLDTIIQSKLIYGLGISYHKEFQQEILEKMQYQHSVLHVIAGVHNVFDIIRLEPIKLLVLGYKQYGNGINYYQLRPVKNSLDKWQYFIDTVMRKHHCSFDNLALAQLNIERLVSQERWAKSFMGDDGRFTMYIDAVTKQYAKSSTSPRIDWSGEDIAQVFVNIQ